MKDTRINFSNIILTTGFYSAMSATVTCILYTRIKIMHYNEIFTFGLFVHSVIGFIFAANISNLTVYKSATIVYRNFLFAILYFFLIFCVFSILLLLQTIIQN